jgi:hypothetical protein
MRGVRRRNIDHHVSGEARQTLNNRYAVLISRTSFYARLVRTDVESKKAVCAIRSRQIPSHLINTDTRKAEPVDQRDVFFQSEHSGTVVTGLGPRRDGSNLNKRETERSEPGNRNTVLVQPGCNPDRISERLPEELDAKPSIFESVKSVQVLEHPAGPGGTLQPPDRSLVHLLRIPLEQERPEKPIPIHQISASSFPVNAVPFTNSLTISEISSQR